MRTVLIILLLMLLTAAVYAEPETKVETVIDAAGKVSVRYITPGNPDLKNEFSPGIHYGTDQEVLWMDDHATSIAEDMVITDNGVYGVTGWWLNVERTAKYEILGSGTPLWEYSIIPNFKMPVGASDDGNVIASTGDVIDLSVWLNGAGPNPSWTATLPPGYKSYGCDVADNGSIVACAYKQETGNGGILKAFEAETGNLVYQVEFDAENGVNGVVVSESGNWMVVSTYYHEYVFNIATAAPFWTGTNYGQGLAAIDADAEYLAKGDFYGNLTLFHRTNTGFEQLWQSNFGGWVTAAAVSADGSTVMGGNMLFNPYRGIVRVLDIAGNVLLEHDEYGDEIGQVALCDDGSVGVAACWGQLDATYGDVFTAFDVASGEVIFNLLDDIDEPGTIFCVDISADGSYAVCGGKAVHARTFGNGGQAYGIELGEPGPMNVTITLSPDSLPIVIPPGGGSFSFGIEIVNNETAPVTFRAWTDVRLPSGVVSDPIIDRNITLGSGVSIIRALSQSVPPRAPAGNYQYNGCVGSVSGSFWNSSSFPFSKSGDGVSGSGGWTISGWGSEAAWEGLPIEFSLKQNYPNPFNPTTTIDFYLPESDNVSLKVFNVLGKEIQQVASGRLSAGYHSVEFNAESLPSGVYFYQLESGKYSEMKKMVLLK